MFSDGRAENRSNKQESQSSSSLSVSHSSEKEESVMGGSCDTLQVPSMAQSRTMVRAASASATSPQSMEHWPPNSREVDSCSASNAKRERTRRR